MSLPAKSLFEQPESAEAEDAKTLRLLRLSGSNFMGLGKFVLDIDGRNASVYGDNAVGKTRLFTAFTWLLFDKDSRDRKDFQIKTLEENGEALHGLEHEVEGVLRLGDREISLRKVYSEKWTKQRGKAKEQFTGHETTHFVDDVSRKKQDYEAFIAGIVDEKAFRLLTSPAYFNEQLHWQERRKILLDVCGDVSDDQVIASDDKLADLREILGKRSLEDHRKVIQARNSEIKKELERIPVRIAEVQRGLPDVSGLDPEKLAGDLASLRAERQAKLEELARTESGGETAEKQKRLRQVEGQLLELENRHRTAQDSAVRTKRSEVEDLRFKAGSAERELTSLAGEQATAEREVERLDERLRQLHEQFEHTQSQEFTHIDDTICPTCGQSLPEERIAEAREKALEAFNLAMAEELEGINAGGKAATDRRKQFDAEAAKSKKAGAEIQKRLADLKGQATAAQTELEKVQSKGGKVSETSEYVKLAQERDALDKIISDLRSGNRGVLDGIRAEAEALARAVAAHERSLLLFDQRKTGEARILELQDQEKALAAEYERLEQELFLTEEFIRTKVRLLEEPVNARFKHATFKLFNVQVNGGLEECCETLYQGVPYSTNLNDGARINVGLDILNTLSEHYGFSAPIFIDHAESVTKLIPVKGQVIRLCVSKDDQTLRIVKEVSD